MNKQDHVMELAAKFWTDAFGACRVEVGVEGHTSIDLDALCQLACEVAAIGGRVSGLYSELARECGDAARVAQLVAELDKLCLSAEKREYREAAARIRFAKKAGHIWSRKTGGGV